MARRRFRGRSVNGIVLLDKPAGISSNSALQRVKRLFAANKAGHTGSLDPIATGVLPICLGEATKISSYLLDANKGYETLIRLGKKTTTGDIEGDITEERPIPPLDEQMILSVLNRFKGEIDQVPPMYSALKKDGQPLYKLARQGIEVERKSRRVTIIELELLAWSDSTLHLRVLCTKGTYIRTLAEDIGEALGCGAHVETLRRIYSEPFRIENTYTLEQLEALKDESHEALDAILQPMDSALIDWPVVSLTADMAFYIGRGQAVQVPKAPTEGLVLLYGDQSQFIGIGHILDDGRVAPKRLICN